MILAALLSCTLSYTAPPQYGNTFPEGWHIVYVPLRELKRRARQFGLGDNTLAFTAVTARVTWLPNDVDAECLDKVRRVEVARARGWKVRFDG